MYAMWRRGKGYAELARLYGTSRQTTRGIVLRFEPALDDYLRHEHFRRMRLLSSEFSS